MLISGGVEVELEGLIAAELDELNRVWASRDASDALLAEVENSVEAHSALAGVVLGAYLQAQAAGGSSEVLKSILKKVSSC